MKAIDMLTDGEKQLFREYDRLRRQGRLTEATQEMRDAMAKYSTALCKLSPLLSRYTWAKGKAAKRKLLWDITREQFINLCETTTHCPITGLELDFSVRGNFGKGSGSSRDNTASLDRIDSSKPYTIDNVQIISWAANRMKNGWSEQEFAEMILRAQVWAQRVMEEQANVAQI